MRDNFSPHPGRTELHGWPGETAPPALSVRRRQQRYGRAESPRRGPRTRWGLAAASSTRRVRPRFLVVKRFWARCGRGPPYFKSRRSAPWPGSARGGERCARPARAPSPPAWGDSPSSSQQWIQNTWLPTRATTRTPPRRGCQGFGVTSSNLWNRFGDGANGCAAQIPRRSARRLYGVLCLANGGQKGPVIAVGKTLRGSVPHSARRGRQPVRRQSSGASPRCPSAGAARPSIDADGPHRYDFLMSWGPLFTAPRRRAASCSRAAASRDTSSARYRARERLAQRVALLSRRWTCALVSFRTIRHGAARGRVRPRSGTNLSSKLYHGHAIRPRAGGLGCTTSSMRPARAFRRQWRRHRARPLQRFSTGRARGHAHRGQARRSCEPIAGNMGRAPSRGVPQGFGRSAIGTARCSSSTR